MATYGFRGEVIKYMDMVAGKNIISIYAMIIVLGVDFHMQFMRGSKDNYENDIR